MTEETPENVGECDALLHIRKQGFFTSETQKKGTSHNRETGRVLYTMAHLDMHRLLEQIHYVPALLIALSIELIKTE